MARTGSLAVGDTLLHVACRADHLPSIRFLLRRGVLARVANADRQEAVDVTRSDAARAEVAAAASMADLAGPSFPERARVRAHAALCRSCLCSHQRAPQATAMLKIAQRVWASWVRRARREVRSTPCAPPAHQLFWRVQMFMGEWECGALSAVIFGTPKGGHYHREVTQLLLEQSDRYMHARAEATVAPPLR